MANIGHRSTQRVMEILELIAFSGVEDGFSLTQVATVLKCPKSSISPILHTLAAGGYLSYDQAQMKYTIGRRLFEVGNTYLNNDDFYVQTLAIMRKVVDLCSESCHLAVLRDDNVLYLLKVDSPEPIRMFSAPGKRLPANTTALGKALLSKSTYQQLESRFPNGLPQITPHTITSLDELYKQLLTVRQTGFAYEKEENSEFVQCIAVPIEKEEMPVMALSVSIPTFRYTEEKGERIKLLLQDARQEIERLLV